MYTTRQDFGKLFNEHKLTGIGVEVGVQNGINSLQISKYWEGMIVCVDIWPDATIFETAQTTLKEANVLFLKGDSIKAASIFADESLDFTYIDADHAYEAVKADFEAWYPKVRTGGIISFHDYGDNDCIGVKIFIDELMQKHPEYEFQFTTDDFWNGMPYQSVWFVKKDIEVFDGIGFTKV